MNQNRICPKNQNIKLYSILLSIALLLVSSFTEVNAQKHYSVSAAGNNAAGAGGKVSYTIGQLFYITKPAPAVGSVAEGIQNGLVYAIPTLTGASQAATVCAGSTAVINLSGLIGSSTSTVAYSINGVAQTPVTGIVADVSGNASFTSAALAASNNGQTLQITAITVTSENPHATGAFTVNVTMSVDPTSVGGTVNSDETICNGSTSSEMSLSGQTGTVTKWQYSVSPFSSWTDIANTNTTYTSGSLSATTQFRAVVKSGVCSVANSNPATITVDPTTVPGTVSGGTTVCSGTNSTLLTLGAHTGSVTGWEYSTNGTIWNPIANLADTYTATDLTVTTQFRAIVQNGVCPALNSAAATVTVDPVSVGGSVAGSTTVCTGTNSTTLTLSGYTGTITKWQYSTNNWGSSTDVANTTTTLTATNLTATTKYRAVITSGVCSSANSADATITVDPASVGGSIAGSATVCSGTNSTTLTLSGYTGSITKWQSSVDNWVTPVDIANTTTTLTATNLTATTKYRAVITSGVCSSANSAEATVTVDPVSVGGSIAGSATVCTGTNSTTLTLSGYTGTITKWQSSVDNWVTPVDIANTTTTLTATNLTATTKYRAVVKSGVCSSANSSDATVTVDPASVGGSVAGSATVCTGTNSTTLTLSGHVGSVTKWQSSEDNWSTINDIVNTTTTLTATDLTATTKYRAVITSGVCSSANSSDATVTVSPLSVGGTVSGGTTVCSGTNSTTLTLSGNVGSVTKWQYSTDNWATSTDVVNVTTTLTATNLVATRKYRAVVTSGACSSDNSSDAEIIVDPVSVGGSIAGSTTVCTGTNSTTLTLSGYTGSITKWQSSVDNWVTPVDIANTTTTLTATNLAATTKYRAVITSGVCSATNSAEATVTVDPASVGGSVAGSATVCTGTNSTTLTLSGHVGNVTKWQSSEDNWSTINDIVNTTTTLTATNLTATTKYRAVVTSGVCSSANSAEAVVTVDPASVGGSIAGSTTVCTGTNSTTLTLSGYTGTITKWQYSTNNWGSSTDVANTTTTLTATNLTATTKYRAVITSGVCSSANSADATITVDPASVGGSIAGSATVCSGTNSTTLTLSGYTGSITKWQSSVDNWVTPVDIANTTTTLTATNLTATTKYRAVITSGVCSSANSAEATVTVDPVSVGGSIAGSATVCTGTNSTTLTLSGYTGTITKWQSSEDNWSTINDIVNTTITLTATDLTATTKYRAVITSGVCAPVYSAEALITVDPASVGGSVAGSATVCTGTNSTTLTLSGHVGSVTKWQSSEDNWSTINDIVNTTTTLTATDLTATTKYRAVITSGVCSSANSSDATVTVSPLSVGGTVSGGTTVCSGTNSTTLTLSGNVGSVTKWQYSTDNWATSTDVANVTTTLTATNLVATRKYRAVVTSGACSSDNSSDAEIIVDPVSVGGSIAGSTTVCTGTNSTTLTLSGYTGSITKWQSSVDNWVTPVDIANTTTTLTATNLAATTKYRAVITSGVCSATNSAEATVTVDPASVGGSVAGSATVCTGTNSTTLTLSGHVGNVTKWQSSEDNWSTINDIVNTTTTLTATNLTATTKYRAVVTSGVCSSANSAEAVVTVDPASVGGSIAGGATVCTGTNSTTLTLSGYTGTITKWQYSTNNWGTANDIANTTTTLTATDLTVSTRYRAVVTSGVCSADISDEAIVTVDPASVGGSIAGSATVCSGTNSTTLTLSGYTGSITKWQSSVDNWVTPVDIANTTTTLNADNLTATTKYRAVITSGVCSSTNSSDATVTVDPASVGGSIAGSTTVCTGTNSTTLTLSGHVGSITKWQSSEDNWSTINDIVNTTITLTATDLTATTKYRAVITSGVCAPVYSAEALITVDPASVGGSVAGSATVCTGTNSTTLTLSGHVGSVTKWQSSEDNWSTINDIVNTTTTLTATDLTATTKYRAVITSGVCSSANSSDATVTVSPLSVGGTVSGGTTVCSGTNSTTLTLSGNVGSVTKWQWSTDNWSTSNDIVNTTTSLTATNLTATTKYRAVVTSGACSSDNSSDAEIIVDPVSVGGSIAGSTTVCTGTNSTTLTLSGYTGSITKWQSSEDNWVTPVDIANTTTTLTATNLAATTKYRAVITSGVCSANNSAEATVTVDPASVGGSVAGSATVCTGTNSTTLTLSGHVGNVTKWQSSEDNWSTINDIVNTTTTLTATNLTATTKYRAVVTSGVCSSANSAEAVVTVDPASVGGSIAGGATVCTGTNSTTLTLSGYTGTITKWQYSTNNWGTANDIANTTTTLTAIDLTVSTRYRAVVTSGVCSADISDEAIVTVDPASVGGSIAGSATVCSGTNSTTLTLSGYTGSITKWQSSVDNWVTPVDIANTTTTLNADNLTATTKYRAVITSGVCSSTNSSDATVTVDPASVGGSIAGSTTVCTGTNSTTLTLSGHVGSITKWQSSEDNWSTINDIVNTTITLTATDLTATTKYRAVITSGVCAPVYSAEALITVDPASVGGSVAGSATVCTGTNSTTLTLSGHVGSVTKWQSSEDNWSTINDIVNTTTTLTATDLTATTKYRAVITSGVCSSANSAEAAVTVSPTLGDPSFTTGATTVCQDAADETYTATATNAVITYSVAPAGAGSIDANTGVMNWNAGFSGTATITANAAGCNGPKTVNRVVTVNPTVGDPAFTTGATTVCQNAADETYTATATDAVITYSVAPVGAGSIDANTGVMDWNAGFSGAATITASAAGCNGPKTVNRVVTVTPTVGDPAFTAGATTVCQDAADETYTATATDAVITYSVAPVGAGSIDANSGVMDWNAGFSGAATITATATGCNGPKTVNRVVTVTPTVGDPAFTAGATTVCQNAADETYTATATDAVITYSVAPVGAGSIDANSGVMDWNAGFSGAATITATATGCNGPKTVNRVVTVTPTVGDPAFTAGATTVCQDAADETYTATATDAVITYSVAPVGAGSIDANTGVMDWNAGFSGAATITASAAGCNGPKTVNRVVTVTPTVGDPAFTAGATTVCQDAADETYTATATDAVITYSVAPVGARYYRCQHRRDGLERRIQRCCYYHCYCYRLQRSQDCEPCGHCNSYCW